jgi:hypothetical protein
MKVDLVLVRGGVRPLLDVLVGNKTSQDLTPSGLWPSDHAGVVALSRKRAHVRKTFLC